MVRLPFVRTITSRVVCVVLYVIDNRHDLSRRSLNLLFLPRLHLPQNVISHSLRFPTQRSSNPDRYPDKVLSRKRLLQAFDAIMSPRFSNQPSFDSPSLSSVCLTLH